jgi:hypothetical protein
MLLLLLMGEVVGRVVGRGEVEVEFVVAEY